MPLGNPLIEAEKARWERLNRFVDFIKKQDPLLKRLDKKEILATFSKALNLPEDKKQGFFGGLTALPGVYGSDASAARKLIKDLWNPVFKSDELSNITPDKILERFREIDYAPNYDSLSQWNESQDDSTPSYGKIWSDEYRSLKRKDQPYNKKEDFVKMLAAQDAIWDGYNPTAMVISIKSVLQEDSERTQKFLGGMSVEGYYKGWDPEKIGRDLRQNLGLDPPPLPEHLRGFSPFQNVGSDESKKKTKSPIEEARELDQKAQIDPLNPTPDSREWAKLNTSNQKLLEKQQQDFIRNLSSLTAIQEQANQLIPYKLPQNKDDSQIVKESLDIALQQKAEAPVGQTPIDQSVVDNLRLGFLASYPGYNEFIQKIARPRTLEEKYHSIFSIRSREDADKYIEKGYKIHPEKVTMAGVRGMNYPSYSQQSLDVKGIADQADYNVDMGMKKFSNIRWTRKDQKPWQKGWDEITGGALGVIADKEQRDQIFKSEFQSLASKHYGEKEATAAIQRLKQEVRDKVPDPQQQQVMISRLEQIESLPDKLPVLKFALLGPDTEYSILNAYTLLEKQSKELKGLYNELMSRHPDYETKTKEFEDLVKSKRIVITKDSNGVSQITKMDAGLRPTVEEYIRIAKEFSNDPKTHYYVGKQKSYQEQAGTFKETYDKIYENLPNDSAIVNESLKQLNLGNITRLGDMGAIQQRINDQRKESIKDLYERIDEKYKDRQGLFSQIFSSVGGSPSRNRAYFISPEETEKINKARLESATISEMRDLIKNMRNAVDESDTADFGLTPFSFVTGIPIPMPYASAINKGLKRTFGENLAPFVGQIVAAGKDSALYQAANLFKEEGIDALTPEQKDLLVLYGSQGEFFKYTKGDKMAELLSNAAAGVLSMAPYMIEFAVTFGPASRAASVVGKGVATAAEKVGIGRAISALRLPERGVLLGEAKLLSKEGEVLGSQVLGSRVALSAEEAVAAKIAGQDLLEGATLKAGETIIPTIREGGTLIAQDMRTFGQKVADVSRKAIKGAVTAGIQTPMAMPGTWVSNYLQRQTPQFETQFAEARPSDKQKTTDVTGFYIPMPITETPFESFVKASLITYGELATELVGGAAMEGIGKLLGRTITKDILGNPIKLAKVVGTELESALGSKSIARFLPNMVKNIAWNPKMAELFKFHNFSGEFAEEVINNISNIVIESAGKPIEKWEENAKKYLSPEQLGAIALSIGAWGFIGGVPNAIRSARRYTTDNQSVVDASITRFAHGQYRAQGTARILWDKEDTEGVLKDPYEISFKESDGKHYAVPSREGEVIPGFQLEVDKPEFTDTEIENVVQFKSKEGVTLVAPKGTEYILNANALSDQLKTLTKDMTKEEADKLKFEALNTPEYLNKKDIVNLVYADVQSKNNPEWNNETDELFRREDEEATREKLRLISQAEAETLQETQVQKESGVTELEEKAVPVELKEATSFIEKVLDLDRQSREDAGIGISEAQEKIRSSYGETQVAKLNLESDVIPDIPGASKADLKYLEKNFNSIRDMAKAYIKFLPKKFIETEEGQRVLSVLQNIYVRLDMDKNGTFDPGKGVITLQPFTIYPDFNRIFGYKFGKKANQYAAFHELMHGVFETVAPDFQNELAELIGTKTGLLTNLLGERQADNFGGYARRVKDQNGVLLKDKIGSYKPIDDVIGNLESRVRRADPSMQGFYQKRISDLEKKREAGVTQVFEAGEFEKEAIVEMFTKYFAPTAQYRANAIKLAEKLPISKTAQDAVASVLYMTSTLGKKLYGSIRKNPQVQLVENFFKLGFVTPSKIDEELQSGVSGSRREALEEVKAYFEKYNKPEITETPIETPVEIPTEAPIETPEKIPTAEIPVKTPIETPEVPTEAFTHDEEILNFVQRLPKSFVVPSKTGYAESPVVVEGIDNPSGITYQEILNVPGVKQMEDKIVKGKPPTVDIGRFAPKKGKPNGRVTYEGRTWYWAKQDGRINNPNTTWTLSANSNGTGDKIKVKPKDVIHTLAQIAPVLTKEQSDTQNKKAQSFGFTSIYHALNAVKKYIGKTYVTFAEIPDSELKETQDAKSSGRTTKEGSKEEVPRGSRTSRRLRLRNFAQDRMEAEEVRQKGEEDNARIEAVLSYVNENPDSSLDDIAKIDITDPLEIVGLLIDEGSLVETKKGLRLVLSDRVRDFRDRIGGKLNSAIPESDEDDTMVREEVEKVGLVFKGLQYISKEWVDNPRYLLYYEPGEGLVTTYTTAIPEDRIRDRKFVREQIQKKLDEKGFTPLQSAIEDAHAKGISNVLARDASQTPSGIQQYNTVSSILNTAMELGRTINRTREDDLVPTSTGERRAWTETFRNATDSMEYSLRFGRGEGKKLADLIRDNMEVFTGEEFWNKVMDEDLKAYGVFKAVNALTRGAINQDEFFRRIGKPSEEIDVTDRGGLLQKYFIPETSGFVKLAEGAESLVFVDPNSLDVYKLIQFALDETYFIDDSNRLGTLEKIQAQNNLDNAAYTELVGYVLGEGFLVRQSYVEGNETSPEIIQPYVEVEPTRPTGNYVFIGRDNVAYQIFDLNFTNAIKSHLESTIIDVGAVKYLWGQDKENDARVNTLLHSAIDIQDYLESKDLKFVSYQSGRDMGIEGNLLVFDDKDGSGRGVVIPFGVGVDEVKSLIDEKLKEIENEPLEEKGISIEITPTERIQMVTSNLPDIMTENLPEEKLILYSAIDKLNRFGIIDPIDGILFINNENEFKNILNKNDFDKKTKEIWESLKERATLPRDISLLEKGKNWFFQTVFNWDRVEKAYKDGAFTQYPQIERLIEQGIENVTKREEILSDIKKKRWELQSQQFQNWISYLDGNNAYSLSFKTELFRQVLSYTIQDGKKKKITSDSERGALPVDAVSVAEAFDQVSKNPKSDILFTYANSLGEMALKRAEAKELKNEYSQTSENGKWVRYDSFQRNPEGFNQTVADLSGIALKTLSTPSEGWCTSSAATADGQLRGGDFYVFMTPVKDGWMPRIAVRMEGDNIGEIRGIEKGQDLEPEMLDEADKFLSENHVGNVQKWQNDINLKRAVKRIHVELLRNPGYTLTTEDENDLIIPRRVGDTIYGGVSSQFMQEYQGISKIESIDFRRADLLKGKPLLQEKYKEAFQNAYSKINNLEGVKHIVGNVDFSHWQGEAPELETIGGEANFSNWQGNAPELKTIGGSAYFPHWQGSAPELKTIGGNADFSNWQGNTPKLETIGGSADFINWQGNTPKLETIGGSAYFIGWQGSAPELKTIGGEANFSNWQGNASKLETIGGSRVNTLLHEEGTPSETVAPPSETLSIAMGFSPGTIFHHDPEDINVKVTKSWMSDVRAGVTVEPRDVGTLPKWLGQVDERLGDRNMTITPEGFKHIESRHLISGGAAFDQGAPLSEDQLLDALVATQNPIMVYSEIRDKEQRYHFVTPIKNDDGDFIDVIFQGSKEGIPTMEAFTLFGLNKKRSWFADNLWTIKDIAPENKRAKSKVTYEGKEYFWTGSKGIAGQPNATWTLSESIDGTGERIYVDPKEVLETISPLDKRHIFQKLRQTEEGREQLRFFELRYLNTRLQAKPSIKKRIADTIREHLVKSTGIEGDFTELLKIYNPNIVVSSEIRSKETLSSAFVSVNGNILPFEDDPTAWKDRYGFDPEIFFNAFGEVPDLEDLIENRDLYSASISDYIFSLSIDDKIPMSQKIEQVDKATRTMYSLNTLEKPTAEELEPIVNPRIQKQNFNIILNSAISQEDLLEGQPPEFQSIKKRGFFYNRDTEYDAIAGSVIRSAIEGIPGANVVKNYMEAELRETGTLNLRGRKVRNAEEFATLARVYNDRRTETIRIFLLKGDQIIDHFGVTSFLTTSAAPWFGKVEIDDILETQMDTEDKIAAINERRMEKGMEFMQHIADRMNQMDADEYIVMHNHPSDSATMSENDIKLFQFMADSLPYMRYNVVISPSQYSVTTQEDRNKQFYYYDIDSNNTYSIKESQDGTLVKANLDWNTAEQEISDLNGNVFRIPDTEKVEPMGQLVRTTNDFVPILQSLNDPSRVVLFGVSPDNTLLGVIDVDQARFLDGRIKSDIRQFRYNLGSSYVHIANIPMIDVDNEFADDTMSILSDLAHEDLIQGASLADGTVINSSLYTPEIQQEPVGYPVYFSQTGYDINSYIRPDYVNDLRQAFLFDMSPEEALDYTIPNYKNFSEQDRNYIFGLIQNQINKLGYDNISQVQLDTQVGRVEEVRDMDGNLTDDYGQKSDLSEADWKIAHTQLFKDWFKGETPTTEDVSKFILERETTPLQKYLGMKEMPTSAEEINLVIPRVQEYLNNKYGRKLPHQFDLQSAWGIEYNDTLDDAMLILGRLDYEYTHSKGKMAGARRRFKVFNKYFDSQLALQRMQKLFAYSRPDLVDHIQTALRKSTKYGSDYALMDFLDSYMAEELHYSLVKDDADRLENWLLNDYGAVARKNKQTEQQVHWFMYVHHAIERNREITERSDKFGRPIYERDSQGNYIALNGELIVRGRVPNADYPDGQGSGISNRDAIDGFDLDGKHIKGLKDFYNTIRVTVKDMSGSVGYTVEGRVVRSYDELNLTPDQIILDVEGITPTEESRKTMEAAQVVWDKLQENRDKMLEFGLISPKTKTNIEASYKHYIPLMDLDMDFFSGKSHSVRGSDVRAATGRESLVEESLSFIYTKLQSTYRRGRQNKIPRTLMKFLMSVSTSPEKTKALLEQLEEDNLDFSLTDLTPVKDAKGKIKGYKSGGVDESGVAYGLTYRDSEGNIVPFFTVNLTPVRPVINRKGMVEQRAMPLAVSDQSKVISFKDRGEQVNLEIKHPALVTAINHLTNKPIGSYLNMFNERISLKEAWKEAKSSDKKRREFAKLAMSSFLDSAGDFFKGATKTLGKLFTAWSPYFLMYNANRDGLTAVINAYHENRTPTDEEWEGMIQAGYVAEGTPKPKGLSSKDIWMDIGTRIPVLGMLGPMFPYAGLMSKAGKAVKHYIDLENGRPVKNLSAEDQKYLDYMLEMRGAGGFVEFYTSKDHETVKKLIEKAHTEISSSQKITKGMMAPAVFLPKLIEEGNRIVETATRVATYIAAREGGYSIDRAASMSKNITVNFNRKGLGPIAGENGFFYTMARDYYLFFNANLQGMSRFYQVLMRNGFIKGFFQRMMPYVTMGFTLAFMNRVLGGEDDDGRDKWDHLDETQKQRNLYLYLGDGTFFPVKMPFGFNIPFYMGYAMEAALQNLLTDGKKGSPPFQALMSSVQTIMDFVDVPGIGSSAWYYGFFPALARPIVSVGTNRSWSGASIHPNFSEGKENVYNTYGNAGAISNEIAQSLYKIGNHFRVDGKNLLSRSPDDINYLINSFGGGLVRTLTELGNFTLDIKSGKYTAEDTGAWENIWNATREAPIFKSITYKPHDKFTLDLLYGYSDQFSSFADRVKHKEFEDMDKKDIRKIDNERKRINRTIESAQKKMKKIKELRSSRSSYQEVEKAWESLKEIIVKSNNKTEEFLAKHPLP